MRRRFEAHLLPVGWLFKNPVEINVVDRGIVRQVAPSNAAFDFGPQVEQPKADTPPIEFLRHPHQWAHQPPKRV